MHPLSLSSQQHISHVEMTLSFTFWTVLCIVGLTAGLLWDVLIFPPAELATSCVATSMTLWRHWVDLVNMFAAGVTLMAAMTAAIMRLLYDHRKRLGTQLGHLDDMPLTVAMTLFVAALLFAAESLVPILVVHPPPSSTWPLMIPHLMRVMFCVPVLHALYTPSAPPSAAPGTQGSDTDRHRGRMFVPLLLDTRVCLASCLVGEY